MIPGNRQSRFIMRLGRTVLILAETDRMFLGDERGH
ncbi:MAG: hypothetical protein K0Q81_2201 [Paenibacillus sp.]|jgi:hypothetical protein|nr:hypothetical protein [Paenibacillus sp.]